MSLPPSLFNSLKELQYIEHSKSWSKDISKQERLQIRKWETRGQGSHCYSKGVFSEDSSGPIQCTRQYGQERKDRV